VRARPTQPEIVAPPSWSAAGPDTAQSPTGDLSQWWTRLGDPVLSDLIAQALKKNTSLRTARANLREARAERNLAAANRFPTVTGTVSDPAALHDGGATISGCAGLVRTHPLHSNALASSAMITAVRGSALPRSLTMVVIITTLSIN